MLSLELWLLTPTHPLHRQMPRSLNTAWREGAGPYCIILRKAAKCATGGKFDAYFDPNTRRKDGSATEPTFGSARARANQSKCARVRRSGRMQGSSNHRKWGVFPPSHD